MFRNPAPGAPFRRYKALARFRWLAVALAVLLIAMAPAASSAPAVSGRYGLPDWFPLRGAHRLGCTNSNGCVQGYHGYWALDIEGNKGDTVYPAGAGRVAARQNSQGANCDASQYSSTAQCPDGAKGNWILIDHVGGVQTFYMHLTDVYVGVGDWVDEASPIGTVGDSGRSTPTFFHLHYEERTPSASVAPRPLAVCQNGLRSSYPSAAGSNSWSGLDAFSVSVRSDGTGCPPQPYRPLAPRRLLDSRFGVGAPSGPIAAESVLSLRVVGGEVPATVASVVLNLTAVSPTATGWLTVWPCGETKPNASNLNFAEGRTIAKLSVVRVGDDGRVCLAVSRTVHLIADLTGFQPTGSTFVSTSPERLLDTRFGVGAPARRLTANQELRVDLAVRGAAYMSPDAPAAAVNVTVVEPAAAGWLTVWPCGETQPKTSNLNFAAGQTVANLAVAKLAPGGALCLSPTAAAHVLVDIAGWYPPGSTDVQLSPTRVLDTRSGVGVRAGTWPRETMLTFSVAGLGSPSVSGGASGAVLNITAVSPNNAGFATVWPCGEPRPTASHLNFEAGDIISNLAVTKLGAGATVCLVATADLQVVADLFGWSP